MAVNEKKVILIVHWLFRHCRLGNRKGI